MISKEAKIHEAIAIIRGKQKYSSYFFSKIKDRKWFEPLESAGFFDKSTIPMPVQTEKGFALSYWPQQGYLERLASQIESQAISDAKFVNSFLNALRKVDTHHGNFLLGKSLFLMVLRAPLSCLKRRDIQLAFSWILSGGVRDSLLEITVQEGLDLMLSKVTDCSGDRTLLKEFTKGLLTKSEEKKSIGGDQKLVFFSDWGYKQFRDKHFNVDELAVDKPFILVDVIDVSTRLLSDMLSTSELDESSQWWRPAIEEHHQNNYYDSAQAIIVGIIGMCVGALSRKGRTIPKVESWRKSRFMTFKRIYLYWAAQTTNSGVREKAARLILDLHFSYGCLHEIYSFLESQFDSLSKAMQEKLLDFIDKIESDTSAKGEIRKQEVAWKKLRWLEAVSSSNNKRAKSMRAEAMQLTEQKLPEHPAFASYMGDVFVGPTSPRDAKWFADSTPEEILREITTFKDTDEFGSPTIDGFARALEAWVLIDPMKASHLVKEMKQIDPRYVSSLLDGYAKCWVERKYVPTTSLFENLIDLVSQLDFAERIEDERTKMCWVVSSICRLIEAGTRDDDNPFDPGLNVDCYSILKKCLESSPAREDVAEASDAYSRAINEPRGQIFQALVVLTLRRARLSKADATEFGKAWNDLAELIDPIVRRQNANEASLHSQLGAFYRQIQFLSNEWLRDNIDLVVPSPDDKPSLWRAFMDGFSYVPNYSKGMYFLLRDRGYLTRYFRLAIDNEDGSSRRNRLQNRMLELAVVAYIVGDEPMDEGIIAAVLKEKDPEEWHEVIWSVQSVIGDPSAEHLQKAKALVSRLIQIKDMDPPEKSFREHFKGLGRFLSLLKEPTDEMVEKIIKIVAEDKDSPWELGDVVEYLHKFKDTHPSDVGALFKTLLDASNVAPAWPQDKVREIAEALLQHGQIQIMIEICRIYSNRSLTCEPIRDICAGICGTAAG